LSTDKSKEFPPEVVELLDGIKDRDAQNKCTTKVHDALVMVRDTFKFDWEIYFIVTAPLITKCFGNYNNKKKNRVAKQLSTVAEEVSCTAGASNACQNETEYMDNDVVVVNNTIEHVLFQQPTSSHNNSVSVESDICPICEEKVLEVNPGNEMQCNDCFRWYHLPCLNLDKNYATSIGLFHCGCTTSKKTKKRRS
jgi:hypothetical protein